MYLRTLWAVHVSEKAWSFLSNKGHNYHLKRWENSETAEALLYLLTVTDHITGLGKKSALPGGNGDVLGSYYSWNYFIWWKFEKKNGINWATLLKDNSGFQKLFLPFAHKWLFISQQQKFSSFLLCLVYSKFTGMFPVTTRLLATLPAAQNTTCLFISCCHITTVLYVTHPLAFHSFQFLQVALESSHDLTFQLYLFFFF